MKFPTKMQSQLERLGLKKLGVPANASIPNELRAHVITVGLEELTRPTKAAASSPAYPANWARRGQRVAAAPWPAPGGPGQSTPAPPGIGNVHQSPPYPNQWQQGHTTVFRPNGVRVLNPPSSRVPSGTIDLTNDRSAPVPPPRTGGAPDGSSQTALASRAQPLPPANPTAKLINAHREAEQKRINATQVDRSYIPTVNR